MLFISAMGTERLKGKAVKASPSSSLFCCININISIRGRRDCWRLQNSSASAASDKVIILEIALNVNKKDIKAEDCRLFILSGALPSHLSGTGSLPAAWLHPGRRQIPRCPSGGADR